MDSVEEEKMWLRIWKAMDDSQRALEKFREQKIDVRIRVILEGFKSKEQSFTVASNLRIVRDELPAREAFYDRVSNLTASPTLAKENEFFAEFDFQTQRRSLQGLAPSNATTLVAAFFALVSKQAFNINKGQFFALDKGFPESLGIHMMPYELRNPPRTECTAEDFDHYKKYWPVFYKKFTGNDWFALIARRFLYSTLKFSREDQLIDLMITLEALLVPERSGNKKDLMATRMGTLLSDSHEPSNVRRLTTQAYSLRNEIIHGNQIIKGADEHLITEISILTQSAVRQYLQSYLKLNAGQLAAALDASDLNFVTHEKVDQPGTSI